MFFGRGVVLTKKGFTLIELIIVLAIILTLSGLAFLGYGLLTESADRRVCETNLAKIDYVYRVQKELEPSLTKEDFFAHLSVYFVVIECPADGSFYLENGVFGCTKHGEVATPDEE